MNPHESSGAELGQNSASRVIHNGAEPSIALKIRLWGMRRRDRMKARLRDWCFSEYKWITRAQVQGILCCKMWEHRDSSTVSEHVRKALMEVRISIDPAMGAEKAAVHSTRREEWRIKDYLGDSVYVEWVGDGSVILTRNNRVVPREVIVLGPLVLAKLHRFVERAREESADPSRCSG